MKENQDILNKDYFQSCNLTLQKNHYKNYDLLTSDCNSILWSSSWRPTACAPLARPASATPKTASAPAGELYPKFVTIVIIPISGINSIVCISWVFKFWKIIMVKFGITGWLLLSFKKKPQKYHASRWQNHILSNISSILKRTPLLKTIIFQSSTVVWHFKRKQTKYSICKDYVY